MNTKRDPRRFTPSAAGPIREIIVLLLVIVSFAMAQAQSPILVGRWNIEIAFGDGSKRSLHFEAQGEGKGSFVDPRAKVWGGGKPSEVKWSSGEGNSVTFTGPVEFMLGNVGRDAGTLTCKGKFEGPDSIAGEVEFAPLVGDRLTRHGTFKATRNKN